jgi:uncharacterized protein (DUF169 family)
MITKCSTTKKLGFLRNRQIKEGNMNIQTYADKISQMIRPQSFPLGVKIIKEENSLPQGVMRPSKYGIQISLCQWTTLARRWGRFAGVLAEDINCSPCLAALGLKKLEDRTDLARYFLDMGYFDTIELAQSVTEQLDPIPAGKIKGIAMFPLDKPPVDPDLVVIYGTPAQMARLASGFLYHSGELIESSTTGFGLSCLSAIKPYFSGKPALVHPGRGERILAGTDESEMFFSFPAKDLELFVDGLEKTHKKGTRYPIQSYMIYQPPVIPPVKTLDEKLRVIN